MSSIFQTRRLTFWTRNHPKCRVSMTEESKKRLELQEKSPNDGNEIKTEHEPNCLTKCFNSKNIDEPEYKG